MIFVTKQAGPAPVSDADKVVLQNALAATVKASPTFAEVRAAMPKAARDRMTDGQMHEVAIALGLGVMPE